MRSLMIAAGIFAALIVSGCSATLYGPSNAKTILARANPVVGGGGCDCQECPVKRPLLDAVQNGGGLFGSLGKGGCRDGGCKLRGHCSCGDDVMIAEEEYDGGCDCQNCATAEATSGSGSSRPRLEAAANRGLLGALGNVGCRERSCKLRGRCSCGDDVTGAEVTGAEEYVSAPQGYGSSLRDRWAARPHLGDHLQRPHLPARAHAALTPHGGIGCGRQGCGRGGILCDSCKAKLAALKGIRGGPGLGAIPHTQQQSFGGPGGPTAPSYAYPYYTTRGPRDFLMKNPPSIGY